MNWKLVVLSVVVGVAVSIVGCWAAIMYATGPNDPVSPFCRVR